MPPPPSPLPPASAQFHKHCLTGSLLSQYCLSDFKQLLELTKKMELINVSKWHSGPWAHWRWEESLSGTLWSDLLVSDLPNNTAISVAGHWSWGTQACAL